MQSFTDIQALAEKRKGGRKKLRELLPQPINKKQLLKLTDDRCLSLMAKCIFRAGFHWKVIDKKWPGFEEAFYQFDPVYLVHQSPEVWDAYLQDTRIVRNWQKIEAVYKNAQFIVEISEQHRSFMRFLCDWPTDDQVGLMLYLKKQGARLGGNTGQYFLRFIGMDSFILSNDVIRTLQIYGLDISDNPSSKRDLQKIQMTFNEWHQSTGLAYSHLSKIAAYSSGENYASDIIKSEMNKSGEL